MNKVIVNNDCNWIVYIDPGHGGTIDGKSFSNGKFSPLLPDGSRFYEGDGNRNFADMLCDGLHDVGINAFLQYDCFNIGLKARVARAEYVQKLFNKKILFVSCHTNASGKKAEWSNSSGYAVFIRDKKNKINHVAVGIANELSETIPVLTGQKNRGVRKKNYGVLGGDFPSILIERWFHTNKKELERRNDIEFIQVVVTVDIIRRHLSKNN